MNKTVPLTLSLCINSLCAITGSDDSVIVLMLSQVHSLARVLGQLVSVNSNARIWVFMRISSHIENRLHPAISVFYGYLVR